MTGQRIESLTADQAAMLPKVRDEWLRHGLSCEPADRATAEDGVRKAYAAAGLEPPRFMIWLDSPLAGVWGGQAIAPLSKGAQVLDQVRDQVRSQVGDQVGDWTDGLIDGYYQHVWSSWIDAMTRIGVTNLEPWDGHAQVAKSAGWWWAFRHFAILTERPVELHRDPQNRLHNEHGPAVRYRDGFAVYAWHGRRVPADMIETDWTTERIFAERNAETRRCAIEKHESLGRG